MNKVYKTPRLVLLTAILFCTVFVCSAQQLKPAQSGYAPVNGIKMYYEVYGAGRPIVLIHGAFLTIQDNWGQLIPELAKTRKVIAIEMQDNGHTPYSERKLALPTLASDVVGVMDYLKVDSADVAGYSLGGSVAYQLILQSPTRVRKLVIISSTYKRTGWRPEVANAFKDMKPDVFDNSPLQTSYNAVAPDKTKWTKYVGDMLAFDANPFDLGDSNIAKITSPVLLISGDNDGLDKVELMKTYQLLGGGITADLGVMPKSHLAIVPAQGHVGVIMQTKTLLGYLDDFLQ